VADVLSVAAVNAFFAVMIAFVFLYDRSVGSGVYQAPGAAEEANGRDEHGAQPV
jgi:hypothetical protein